MKNKFLASLFLVLSGVSFIYFIVFFLVALFNNTPETIQKALFGAVFYYTFANLWTATK